MLILQALEHNAQLVLIAVAAVLAVLNLAQLWWGRRYLVAIREHDAELRQLRLSMQQLEADRDAWFNKLILMMEHVPETEEKLQSLSSALKEARTRQEHWSAAAEQAATELRTLLESDAVKEIIAADSRA